MECNAAAQTCMAVGSCDGQYSVINFDFTVVLTVDDCYLAVFQFAGESVVFSGILHDFPIGIAGTCGRLLLILPSLLSLSFDLSNLIFCGKKGVFGMLLCSLT